MYSNLYSNLPEEKYARKIRRSHLKNLAQFFTPISIASFMASWVISNRKNIKILDPAIGLGVFIRAAFQLENTLNFVGYDIDSSILNEAESLLLTNKINIKLENKDYLFNDWENKYDGIICNPPYLKFQQFKNRADVLIEFKEKLDLEISGFSNIYTLFLIKSLSQLNSGGKLAYLIPSEFLNSDYGKIIKELILNQKMLRYVIIFDFQEKVFNDAITTSSIFLFANDKHNQTIEFINIKSPDEVKLLTSKLSKYPNSQIIGKKIEYSEIKPEKKWRIYYQEIVANSYKNLVPFSNYGKVVRGIATGANDYFTFDQQKQEKFKIPATNLLPCICKSNQVKSSIFTQKHFESLVNRGDKVYLFKGENGENEAVKSYLELGEKLAIDKKYLTKRRKPWYAVEKRQPAPIWVGVFNRSGLKFIRNETQIRNLTTFHCVYVNPETKIDLLFSYLLTDVAKGIFNDNCREYGGGLKKFEPNDLNNGMMLNLDIIDDDREKEIIELYQAYRLSILQDKPDNLLLNQINEIFEQYLR